jgi:hypothetical protein
MSVPATTSIPPLGITNVPTEPVRITPAPAISVIDSILNPSAFPLLDSII